MNMIAQLEKHRHVLTMFFILKKVTNRCISTAHLDTITSMINLIIKVIDSEYIEFFQRKMSTAFSGHESGNSKAVELAKLAYMVVLNNLDVSALYIQRLSDEALKHADKNLIDGEEYQRLEKALTQLGGMSDKMKKRLNAGLEQLFVQTLKPRIRPLYQEAYRDVKYVLDEDEYNEADSNDLLCDGSLRVLQAHRHLSTYFDRSQLCTHARFDCCCCGEAVGKNCTSNSIQSIGSLAFRQGLEKLDPLPVQSN